MDKKKNAEDVQYNTSGSFIKPKEWNIPNRILNPINKVYFSSKNEAVVKKISARIFADCSGVGVILGKEMKIALVKPIIGVGMEYLAPLIKERHTSDLFIGSNLEGGYGWIFPTLPDNKGEVKGNVDADLVLQAMIDYEKCSKALIVSSDGDFYSLVKYLYKNDKLKFVISPYIKTCSVLLKKTAKEKIIFMDNLRKKLEYKKKKHR